LIELLLSFCIAAFPVRGSVWQAADSNLVVDGDTLHFSQACVVGYCYSCQYTLREANTKPLISNFFGAYTGVSGAVASVVWDGTPIMSDPEHPTTCTPQVHLTSAENIRFRVHGTADWAIWADSIQYTIKNGAVQRPVLLRWRWSRVDTAIPWVRWVDTLHLGRKESPIGQAIATTLRATTLDDLGTQSQMAHIGLFLRAKIDSSRSVDWGFGEGKPHVPAEEIPAGRTFRVLDAYNPQGGWIVWNFSFDGKVADRMPMEGVATTKIPSRPLPIPAQTGIVAFEPATGRRVHLGSPMTRGGHLLTGPDGTRLVVVE
jgi:hypothetical protein